MSAKYVRDTVRDWCIGLSIAPTFYDTINQEQDPRDNLWWTAEFFATGFEGQNYCQSGYMENGEFDLIFMATAGIGDSLILDKIELVIPKFRMLKDPTNQLNVDIIRPVETQLGGQWFRLAVGFSYIYSA